MGNKVSIKKNDIVVVIAGKDKGKKGKVLKVLPKENRAVVEKVNFVKEFVRPNPQRNIQGGIMEKEAPIHISNLMIYCPECDRGVRIRKRILEDGTKVRICHRCGTSLDR
ncbi:50S ribosomal protein L24 [Candidatus Aminicenantes bacterium AC-708-M15]|jgi:large subunit ribosomal protein L24|nr:50S ribosomal protein L24 [SCandidatus Aminicenantes bacterium Aminicenantia_JdfR_composite]MCP2598762.1 50S ribosomal protein L24 [Candidatus Aminicenantes bacterium AC-335-L06]MCP2599124.1 50S ribosomal protein L24 [Candidatus Aminicenantes bacterium AC-335-B20]MCP2604071.1 50S ribosomal protein L24 [Candidatus Aminicenantes bacterium AC-708-M15]MCP2605360.1 50S ribosomal protein L24 [Candidatus Aminicenantes bacterium AC-335-O07]MCP2606029.1 50S ribosomal protein L24 [Candidatus Aminicen